MTELVMGLVIGFVVGSTMLSVLLYVMVKRVRAGQAERIASQEETIADLRQEMAEDRETNRHLRHQIHSLSPGDGGAASIGLLNAGQSVEVDRAMSERDAARRQLADAQRSLESTRARLEDREAKLREYREAVKEIRLSLESQDRLRSIITITQDVPANAQAETS